jgi:hypothetical protein
MLSGYRQGLGGPLGRRDVQRRNPDRQHRAEATSNPTTRSTAATTRLPRRLATATNMPPPVRIGRFRLVRLANALVRLK